METNLLMYLDMLEEQGLVLDQVRNDLPVCWEWELIKFRDHHERIYNPYGMSGKIYTDGDGFGGGSLDGDGYGDGDSRFGNGQGDGYGDSINGFGGGDGSSEYDYPEGDTESITISE